MNRSVAVRGSIGHSFRRRIRAKLSTARFLSVFEKWSLVFFDHFIRTGFDKQSKNNIKRSAVLAAIV